MRQEFVGKRSIYDNVCTLKYSGAVSGSIPPLIFSLNPMNYFMIFLPLTM